MCNTIRQVALGVIQSKSTATIGDEIIRKLGSEMGDIGDFMGQLINVVVVPAALILLFITMFFLLLSMAADHRKQNNEGFESKFNNLVICLVVFIFIGGYGLLFGDLMKFITG